MVVVISGSPGVGKSTLCKLLQGQYPRLTLCISHTTRAPRTGETQGVHYHFVSKTHFEKMIENQQFIEYAQILDFYYGTSVEALESICRSRCIPLLEIDIQGAHSLRKLGYSGLYLFVLPPSLEALQERLLKRGTPADELKKRLRWSSREMNQILSTHSLPPDGASRSSFEPLLRELGIRSAPLQESSLPPPLYDRLIINQNLPETTDQIHQWIQFALGGRSTPNPCLERINP